MSLNDSEEALPPIPPNLTFPAMLSRGFHRQCELFPVHVSPSQTTSETQSCDAQDPKNIHRAWKFLEATSFVRQISNDLGDNSKPYLTHSVKFTMPPQEPLTHLPSKYPRTGVIPPEILASLSFCYFIGSLACFSYVSTVPEAQAYVTEPWIITALPLVFWAARFLTVIPLSSANLIFGPLLVFRCVATLQAIGLTIRFVFPRSPILVFLGQILASLISAPLSATPDIAFVLAEAMTALGLGSIYVLGLAVRHIQIYVFVIETVIWVLSILNVIVVMFVLDSDSTTTSSRRNSRLLIEKKLAEKGNNLSEPLNKKEEIMNELTNNDENNYSLYDEESLEICMEPENSTSWIQATTNLIKSDICQILKISFQNKCYAFALLTFLSSTGLFYGIGTHILVLVHNNHSSTLASMTGITFVLAYFSPGKLKHLPGVRPDLVFPALCLIQACILIFFIFFRSVVITLFISFVSGILRVVVLETFPRFEDLSTGLTLSWLSSLVCLVSIIFAPWRSFTWFGVGLHFFLSILAYLAYKNSRYINYF